MSADTVATLDAFVDRLKAAGWKDREAIKDELLAYAATVEDTDVLGHLENIKRGLPLEVRWEIDEVIEKLTPEPEPEPEPEEPEAEAEEEQEEADDPGRPLRMSDLVEVYADPRGIALFTDKKGKRWFLSQPDPYTGQPMVAELPPDQIPQVKAQLQGSPYWRIGSGVAP